MKNCLSLRSSSSPRKKTIPRTATSARIAVKKATLASKNVLYFCIKNKQQRRLKFAWKQTKWKYQSKWFILNWEKKKKFWNEKISKACAKTKVLGRIWRLRKDISELTVAKKSKSFSPHQKVKFVASKYNNVRPLQFSSTSLDMFDAYLDAGRIGLAGNSLRHFKKKNASAALNQQKKKRKTALSWFFFL